MSRQTRLWLIAGLTLALLAWPGWQAWRWWLARGIYEEAADDPAPTLTHAHLAALRRLRFTWNTLIESGGPVVDPAAPYGSADMAEDLGPLLGSTDRVALARFHRAVSDTLIWALAHCDLPAGPYRLAHLDNAAMERQLRADMAGLPPERIAAVLATLPRLQPDGVFQVTDQHRRLLRELRIEWPGPTLIGLVSEAGYPAPIVHFKRPFGDMTAFEIDMAAILGLPRPLPGVPSDPLFDRLYWQMWPALQAFVEYAPIGPDCR